MGPDPDYEDERIEPPITVWPSLTASAAPVPEPIRSMRTALRPRLLDLARQYTDRLTQVAEAAGVVTADANVSAAVTQQTLLMPTEGQRTVSDRTPLIITGHQPVVFHSGLTFKYRVTELGAAAIGGVSLAVVMDTDDGDAGQFEYPKFAAKHSEHVHSAETADAGAQFLNSDAAGRYSAIGRVPYIRRETTTLGDGTGLFQLQRLKNAKQIQDLRDEVIVGLRGSGCETAIQSAARAFDAWATLSVHHVSMAEANIIVRRSAGIGMNTLEFPFSGFCQLPEVIELTRTIMNHAEEFSEHYNRTLDSFRMKHGIDNPANPFPNLNRRGSDFELPFWLIQRTTGLRQRLQIRTQSDSLEILGDNGVVSATSSEINRDTLEALDQRGILVAPRGALITAFMRILAADLFVHGIGGGRYDRFTDELIRSWWSFEPSAWTVATASRYLFRDLRHELEALDVLESHFRDYQYNPQRYLGTGVFTALNETRLMVLLADKQRLVEELRSRQSAGLPAAEVGRQVQQMTDQIRATVAGEFSEQRLLRSQISGDNRSGVCSRLYPWFFFRS